MLFHVLVQSCLGCVGVEKVGKLPADEEEDLNLAELISKGEVAWLHKEDAPRQGGPGAAAAALLLPPAPISVLGQQEISASGRSDQQKRKVRSILWISNLKDLTLNFAHKMHLRVLKGWQYGSETSSSTWKPTAVVVIGVVRQVQRNTGGDLLTVPIVPPTILS